MTRFFARSLMFSVLAVALLFNSGRAWAHCDGLDGPVVTAARSALKSGDVERVLIWVHENDEAEIRGAFSEARKVRKLGPEAQALADRYFFETLVRIHRAGEGAPYTGLKPAGRDIGPAIPAADKAIHTGSVAPVLELLTGRIKEGLRSNFKAVTDKKDFSPADVSAGREYVTDYVTYIHYVERLYDTAGLPPEGHYPDH